MWDILATYSEGQEDYTTAERRRAAHCRAVEGSWPGDAKRWEVVGDAYNNYAIDAAMCGKVQPCLEKCVSVLERARKFHGDTPKYQQLMVRVSRLRAML